MSIKNVKIQKLNFPGYQSRKTSPNLKLNLKLVKIIGDKTN